MDGFPDTYELVATLTFVLPDERKYTYGSAQKRSTWNEEIKKKKYTQATTQDTYINPVFLHSILWRMTSGHCLVLEHLFAVLVSKTPLTLHAEKDKRCNTWFSLVHYKKTILMSLLGINVPKELIQPVSIHDTIFNFLNKGNAELIVRFL